MDVDSMEDNATTLNNNIKGNAEQLELMFAAEEFPDIEITQTSQIVMKSGSRRVFKV